MNLHYNYAFSIENCPNSSKVEKGHILPLSKLYFFNNLCQTRFVSFPSVFNKMDPGISETCA